MWLGVSVGVGLRVLGPSHTNIDSGLSVLPKPKLYSQWVIIAQHETHVFMEKKGTQIEHNTYNIQNQAY